MQLPANLFKQALQAGRPQIGLWVGLADAYATEVVATAGFDWLLIDNEHAPNDVRSTLSQLQAAAAYPSHCVVRPVNDDPGLIKQYLDVGAQSLLIPMIDTPEQAEAAVAATRYPPRGIRGVGYRLARCSRWGKITDYLEDGEDEICLLVQAESVEAMANLSAIAAVDGVDGVFIGPADLSASMGFLGNPDAPEVREAIARGIGTLRDMGKAPGIIATDQEHAREYLAMGALFVAVGVDSLLLATAARQLAASFLADHAPGDARRRGGIY